jgi:hypothetical protein
VGHNDAVADPAAVEYRARRARWALEHENLTRRDRSIAIARLAVFAVAAILLVTTIRGGLSAWWLLLPAAAFVPLLQRHDRVIRARKQAARLIDFYDRGLARLDGRWIGMGDTGERFLSDDHLYAADLDLFGRGSLFELLSLARTRTGEETLAGWLKYPATPGSISARHRAVDELRHALDLREALNLAGAEIRAGVHPDELHAWAGEPSAAPSAGARAVALVLTAILPLLLFAAWWFDSLTYLLAAAVLRTAYQQVAGDGIEQLLRRAEPPARDLVVLRPALELLHSRPFDCAALRALQADLEQSHSRASDAINTLRRYVEMHEWTHNVFFTPIAAVLMWDTHLAWAIERWRAIHGVHIGRWLRIVGEFEALSSIAAYAYEHPDDTLPAVTDDSTPGQPLAIFTGTGLGHPLLPESQMVRNDVRLDAGTRLIVISGSNMSGKSTLLRTVGINAVLALAGAPVRATALEISPLAIGATLRIQDSLQQGRSRFFAEITRIRQIADVAARQPLLFLLDELFHGTNSHDRLTGATGVLRTLLARGAIGLITTHDLALTAITRDLGAQASNAHFEDSFDGAEIRFDYRMKPGPVARSNAIALMRAVGLDVRENPS